MLDKIIKSAYALGACDRLGEISDFTHLIDLFFSPQGQEFCEKYNYPSLDVFRQIKDDVKIRNIYVDQGHITLSGKQHICLVGNTSAVIQASGVAFVHTIILMHGSKATIKASNHAVLKIVNISGLEVTIHKDQTVVEL